MMLSKSFRVVVSQISYTRQTSLTNNCCGFTRGFNMKPRHDKRFPKDLKIRFVTEEDKEAVSLHMQKNFIIHEPLNKAVKLDPKCSAINNFCLKDVKDDLSLMAVTMDNKIAGLCMNGKIELYQKPQAKFAEPKLAKVLKFLEKVEKDVNIFSRYPKAEKVFNMEIFSVDSAFRGKGICRELVLKSLDLAKEQGFPVAIVICTSVFSAKLVSSLGFRAIYTIQYKDYLENGKPVFITEPPHLETKVFIKDLSRHKL